MGDREHLSSPEAPQKRRPEFFDWQKGFAEGEDPRKEKDRYTTPGRSEAKEALKRASTQTPKERLHRALRESVLDDTSGKVAQTIAEALEQMQEDAEGKEDLIKFLVLLRKKERAGVLDLQQELEQLKKEEAYARKQSTEVFLDTIALLGQKISFVGELMALAEGEKKKGVVRP